MPQRIPTSSIPGDLTPHLGQEFPFSVPTNATLTGLFLSLTQAPSGGDAVVEVRTAPSGGGAGAAATFADGEKAATWTGSIDLSGVSLLYLRPLSETGSPQNLTGTIEIDGGDYLTTLEEVRQSYGSAFSSSKFDSSPLDSLAVARIASVSDRIRRYTKRHLTQQVITGEKYSHGGTSDVLQLAEYPIQSIQEVRFDGTAIAGSEYSFDAREGLCGHLISETGAWPAGRRHIEVDYTAGYTEIPPELSEAATIQVIWDMQRNPATGGKPGVRQSVVDAGQETFLVDAWAPDVLNRLQDFRSHL